MSRPSSRRRYVTGEASRENIIEEARRVLVRDGYHAFTTRRVAEACGISVGNLTYYFPNKSALVEAIVEVVFERYERRYRELLAGGGSRGSEDPVADLVAWFLRDAVTDATAGLFMELWVIAKHHRFSSEALTRFYDQGVRNVARALAAHRPDLSESELQRIAYLMLTLSEGSTAVLPDRVTARSSTKRSFPLPSRPSKVFWPVMPQGRERVKARRQEPDREVSAGGGAKPNPSPSR